MKIQGSNPASPPIRIKPLLRGFLLFRLCKFKANSVQNSITRFNMKVHHSVKGCHYDAYFVLYFNYAILQLLKLS